MAAIVALVWAGLATWPGVAAACALDDTASLWANDARAAVTLAAPRELANWAPFVVDEAFASMAPVRLREDPADLARSLPAATVAAPYRWAFGDGSSALGHMVVHRYRHPGLFKITIWGRYDLTSRTPRWLPFDSVLLRIVPPGQVLRANLGYWLSRVVQTLLSDWVWGCDALLVLIVAASAVRPWLATRRRRRAAPAGPRRPWYDAGAGRRAVPRR